MSLPVLLQVLIRDCGMAWNAFVPNQQCMSWDCCRYGLDPCQVMFVRTEVETCINAGKGKAAPSLVWSFKYTTPICVTSEARCAIRHVCTGSMRFSHMHTACTCSAPLGSVGKTSACCKHKSIITHGWYTRVCAAQ